MLFDQCQTLHLRLLNLPRIFFSRHYICVAFLPTMCVVQHEPCPLIVGIITISVFCVSPWNINVAASHYTVFVLCHVSPSVVGPSVLLKHRQSVFIAWHTTLPLAIASERYRPPITYCELYVLNSVTLPQVWRTSLWARAQIVYTFRRNYIACPWEFEIKIRYWRRLQ